MNNGPQDPRSVAPSTVADAAARAGATSADSAPRRRPYVAPTLTRYGRVEDLTRSGGTTGLELKKLKKQ